MSAGRHSVVGRTESWCREAPGAGLESSAQALPCAQLCGVGGMVKQTKRHRVLVSLVWGGVSCTGRDVTSSVTRRVTGNITP